MAFCYEVRTTEILLIQKHNILLKAVILMNYFWPLQVGNTTSCDFDLLQMSRRKRVVREDSFTEAEVDEVLSPQDFSSNGRGPKQLVRLFCTQRLYVL